MATYAQFSIQEVIPDISTKTITIKTNFKVDPNTVSQTTVAYYSYDSGKLETYQLRVDGKDIIIDFLNYPDDNSRYYLKVAGIQDALGRKLSATMDSYIKFEKDIKTKIKIISPVSRSTSKSRLIPIRLQVTEPSNGLTYRIELSTDNIFFNKVCTMLCAVPDEYLESEQDAQRELKEFKTSDTGLSATPNDGYYYNGEIHINTTVDHEGQIYLRARAELNEGEAGDWSETICFNILTISMDSIDTTFLEESLTTEDLFDDSIDKIQTEIVDRADSMTNEGMFFLEFNKEIKLPDEYELDENGYVNLGIVIGYRKELK